MTRTWTRSWKTSKGTAARWTRIQIGYDCKVGKQDLAIAAVRWSITPQL
jgi:hypothetical protein